MLCCAVLFCAACRSMAKEDRQVAEAVDKVLDKMIKKVCGSVLPVVAQQHLSRMQAYTACSLARADLPSWACTACGSLPCNGQSEQQNG